MLLIELLERCNESMTVEVYDNSYTFLGMYDGKNSIDSRLNNIEVQKIDTSDLFGRTGGKLYVKLNVDIYESLSIGQTVVHGWQITDFCDGYVLCVDPNGDPDDHESYMTFNAEELFDDIFR